MTIHQPNNPYDGQHGLDIAAIPDEVFRIAGVHGSIQAEAIAWAMDQGYEEFDKSFQNLPEIPTKARHLGNTAVRSALNF